MAFLDIGMPYKTGLDVLEWIRSSPTFRALPVMLLSSFDTPENRQRASQLSADGFFLKTSELRDLKRAVKDFYTVHWPKAEKMYAPR